jgi:hypothetical protein
MPTLLFAKEQPGSSVFDGTETVACAFSANYGSVDSCKLIKLYVQVLGNTSGKCS